MFGESVVAAIVCRNRHDRACSITGQYIVADPDGHRFARERIDGIRTTEDTRYRTIGDTLTLCALAGPLQVSLDIRLLLCRSQLRYQFALRSQYHEGDTKHRIGTGREDGEFHIAVLDLETNFCSLATANPVPLGLFQGVGPVDRLQAIQQALGISGNTQAPLAHHFLLDWITATNRDTVDHLIVGQYRSQLRTPVNHRIAQVSDAVVHQGLLFLLLAFRFPLIRGEA